MSDECQAVEGVEPTKIGVFSQTGEVSFDDVQKIAHAGDRQLKEHVCPAHGKVPWTVTAYASPDDVPDDTIPALVAANADVARALGYHDVDPKGRAYIKIFSDDTLKYGGKVLKGDNSVAVTATHEFIEACLNARCNRWVDCSDSTEQAEEGADRCESQSYDIPGTEASVSNFLLPAGFDANAPAGSKRDYLGSLQSDVDILPGGYRIYRRPGKEQQEFARHADEATSTRLDEKGRHHFHKADGSHVVYFRKSGVFVHFGPEFPDHKKTTKLDHAASRTSRRALAA